MDVFFALAVAVLFASGVYALLQRDVVRAVAGMALVMYAVNLLILLFGLSRGRAPIHPVPAGAEASDPLVQALVLTAIVIGSATTAILVGISYRAFHEYRTLDHAEVTASDPGGEEQA